jgi:hypothetical protein
MMERNPQTVDWNQHCDSTSVTLYLPPKHPYNEGLVPLDSLALKSNLEQGFQRNPTYLKCALDYARNIQFCVNQTHAWRDLYRDTS